MKVRTIEYYANNPVIEHVPGILQLKISSIDLSSNASFEEFSGFSPRRLVGLSVLICHGVNMLKSIYHMKRMFLLDLTIAM